MIVWGDDEANVLTNASIVCQSVFYLPANITTKTKAIDRLTGRQTELGAKQ